MFRTQIEIFTPRSFGRIPRHPEDGYMAEDVTESIIHQISEEKLIKRVQISDYIPNTVLEKLNCLFTLRPDISFRVYGGADKNLDMEMISMVGIWISCDLFLMYKIS